MRRSVLVVLTLFGLAIFAVTPAPASTLTFNYNQIFSNTTSPGGTSPYLTAVFNDDVDGNGYDGFVTLTLSASGLVGSEFVDGGSSYNNKGWLFNFNPDKSLSALTFTYQGGQATAGITTGSNAYKADGDGSYDIFFGFAKSGAGRLTAGETSVYRIGGISGLISSDFNFLSNPEGGSGPFLSAAHIQGIATGEGSTWVRPGDTPIPEPGTMVLLGTGLVGLAGWGRKKFRK